jgi:hypothetical protein
MEEETLNDVYVKHYKLSQIKPEGLTIQEMTRISLELRRLSKLGLKLIDEYEADLDAYRKRKANHIPNLAYLSSIEPNKAPTAAPITAPTITKGATAEPTTTAAIPAITPITTPPIIAVFTAALVFPPAIITNLNLYYKYLKNSHSIFYIQMI